MAREFWEMFLPEDIIVLGARWDGKSGVAQLKFRYPDSSKIFVASFIKNNACINSDWHLDEIV